MSLLLCIIYVLNFFLSSTSIDEFSPDCMPFVVGAIYELLMFSLRIIDPVIMSLFAGTIPIIVIFVPDESYVADKSMFV